MTVSIVGKLLSKNLHGLLPALHLTACYTLTNRGHAKLWLSSLGMRTGPEVPARIWAQWVRQLSETDKQFHTFLSYG